MACFLFRYSPYEEYNETDSNMCFSLTQLNSTVSILLKRNLFCMSTYMTRIWASHQNILILASILCCATWCPNFFVVFISQSLICCLGKYLFCKHKEKSPLYPHSYKYRSIAWSDLTWTCRFRNSTIRCCFCVCFNIKILYLNFGFVVSYNHFACNNEVGNSVRRDISVCW